MTVYSTIKAKIYEKLLAVTQLQQVYDYPIHEINGYPCATFYPIEGEVETESTAEDLRTYGFQVDIYYQVSEESTNGSQSGIAEAIDGLFNVVDYVLDSFSTDKFYTGISMPSGYTFLEVSPVYAGWEQDDENKCLIATIKLNHKVSITGTSNC